MMAVLTIENRLNKIFSDRYGINFENDTSTGINLKNENLLGKTFGMKARDLLYIYFDIERDFGITISQENIASGRFNTYNNIIDIIRNQIESH